MSKRQDHFESVAEELRLFGFDVKVIQGDGFGCFIEHETIAGTMRYSCSEKTIMGDAYRFISHLGARLNKWGLENKLKELKGGSHE